MKVGGNSPMDIEMEAEDADMEIDGVQGSVRVADDNKVSKNKKSKFSKNSNTKKNIVPISNKIKMSKIDNMDVETCKRKCELAYAYNKPKTITKPVSKPVSKHTSSRTRKMKNRFEKLGVKGLIDKRKVSRRIKAIGREKSARNKAVNKRRNMSSAIRRMAEAEKRAEAERQRKEAAAKEAEAERLRKEKEAEAERLRKEKEAERLRKEKEAEEAERLRKEEEAKAEAERRRKEASSDRRKAESAERRRKANAQKKNSCPSKGITPTRLKSKSEYRKALLVFHPDKNPDCAAEAKVKFQNLNNLNSHLINS